MKILILNWRSYNDPKRGGAEIATYEHALRWIKNHNAEVTWLSPRYDKNIHHEQIDGINFHYIGPVFPKNTFKLIFAFWWFYFLTIITYFRQYRNNVDVVVDSVHGIPYLTPFYVKEKIVVFVCEVAGGIWDKMYPFPINVMGKVAEWLFYLPYRFSTATLVSISESTTRDLKNLGLKSVSTVYCGVTLPENINDYYNIKKEENFTLIYLNRLVKMKGIERALEVFSRIYNKDNSAQLWVVGRGDDAYTKFLKDLATELNIRNNVVFHGFVSEEEKFTLLAKAHVLINSSYKEGWGLCNIEANTVNTPAVAFKVEGNVESIKHGTSGYLVEDANIEDMVSRILSLKNNTQMQQTALQFSKQFNWDDMATEFYKVLQE